MTDQEIVDGLINRDEKITDWFFNIKYRPLFIKIGRASCRERVY